MNTSHDESAEIICADCGASIGRRGPHGLWAEDKGAGEYVFACRATIEEDWGADVPYRYTSVDYHVAEGEKQRRWRLGDA